MLSAANKNMVSLPWNIKIVFKRFVVKKLTKFFSQLALIIELTDF